MFSCVSLAFAAGGLLHAGAAGAQEKLPPAAWVRPESQHLTFAFLGEQDETLIDKLAPLVEKQVGAVPRFEGVLANCGFFPNPRHARVG